MSAPSPLLDLSSPDVVRTFQVINDGIMGGVSTSRLSLVSGCMTFEGEVSLENDGGFASFRGPVRIPVDSRALLLTVRGDGRRYKLTLRLDDAPRAAQYQASFVAARDWGTPRFLPADFHPSFRGRTVAAPRLYFGDVRYIGLLISDRQAGPFKIELMGIDTEGGANSRT